MSRPISVKNLNRTNCLKKKKTKTNKCCISSSNCSTVANFQNVICGLWQHTFSGFKVIIIVVTLDMFGKLLQIMSYVIGKTVDRTTLQQPVKRMQNAVILLIIRPARFTQVKMLILLIFMIIFFAIIYLR